MKKISENTKVTLTLGQLKRLVKESLESSSDGADALIDQIYRMIEAGDARRALSFFNRKKDVIARAYPGALRELESLINDNL